MWLSINGIPSTNLDLRVLSTSFHLIQVTECSNTKLLLRIQCAEPAKAIARELGRVLGTRPQPNVDVNVLGYGRVHIDRQLELMGMELHTEKCHMRWAILCILRKSHPEYTIVFLN